MVGIAAVRDPSSFAGRRLRLQFEATITTPMPGSTALGLAARGLTWISMKRRRLQAVSGRNELSSAPGSGKLLWKHRSIRLKAVRRSGSEA